MIISVRSFIMIFLLFSLPFIEVQAQENYEVRNIKIRGNETLDKDFLLERMVIKEVSWFGKVVLNDEPFLYSKELIGLDVERLVRIYQSEGFLHATATIKPVDINDKKTKLNLLIEVEEGDPVTVDTIRLEVPAETKLVKMDSLFRRMNQKPLLTHGERFRDEAIVLDLQLLDDAYRTLGYAYARSDYQLNLNPGQLTTSIKYSSNPEPLS